MLAILFSAIRALPIKVYIWAAGLLAVGGYVFFLNIRLDLKDKQIKNLQSKVATLETAVISRDQAIQLQNATIEAWKVAGEDKKREVREAQARADQAHQANLGAIEQLKQAQAPGNAEQAIGWLAMNYNTWASKVAK